MDKQKLIIEKQHQSKGFKPCYIDADLHQRIKDLSNETHVSMARIIAKFLWYGLKHVEIVDPESEERNV